MASDALERGYLCSQTMTYCRSEDMQDVSYFPYMEEISHMIQ
jgi:hypothetical protein